jgi:hypothetical protein
MIYFKHGVPLSLEVDAGTVLYIIDRNLIFACFCLMKIHELRPSSYVMYHQVLHIKIYPQSAFVFFVRFAEPKTKTNQDRQCIYNVTLRLVRVTIVLVEK